MGKYFGTDGFRGEAGITLTSDNRRGLTLLQNSSDKVKICKSLRDCARRRNRKEEDFVAEVAT